MSLAKMIAVSTAALATLLPISALAESFTVTDVVGREVTFDRPVQRVILGEGRMLYGLAPIEKEDPFAKVVGWRNDLKNNDGDGYNAYVKKFPKAKDIPFLGNLTDGTLQTETVVDLKPDVMLLPIGNKKAADEVKLEEMLDGIGVKIVYIDFREHILDNTEPSLKILGKLFGHEDRADAVAAYWKQQMARVTDKLKQANPKKPNVFMYRAAGLVECCGTFGPDNFGLMVDWAGGHNLGSDFLPGYTGSINAEQVVASNPDVIVATGANWSNTKDAKDFVNVGPNAAASVEDSREALNALMKNPAFTGSKAVADGRVHAIWHQFYTSPYQFVAVQQMAKWFHPELFADLDPDATFEKFHERFLPVDYDPGYWVDAKAAK
ncbi:ABC transporter substrate-binding protein [Rhizobium sp. NTR19]|uniref:ABC transporter substrate-binding protein n=1 Tax=Neorhizobium turbinariae TaxID=2937795 RepID=A0ABT0IXS3_9HYPH|nr:ABC transporter substrate-binding protein [Neorhizobium turbinariae]MCK8782687.1 ABC transporter substrate-binding protein [Neorhizobium turbinariae]